MKNFTGRRTTDWVFIIMRTSTKKIKRARRRRKTHRTRRPSRRTIWHSLIIDFLGMTPEEQAKFLADLEVQGRQDDAAEYRRMYAEFLAGIWQPIHDKDFAEQKARKGDSFYRLPGAALDRLAGADKEVEAELDFVLPSGRRGGQFLREQETSGKWVKADALLVDRFLERIRLERLQFRYDELNRKTGRVYTKRKDIQVSKVALERDPTLVPTPLTTLEVQAAPQVVHMLKLLFEDLRAKGVPDREAEDKVIEVFLGAMERLINYLERRTGQRVVEVFYHTDSGKFHFGFYLTRVDEKRRQIGVVQLGTCGQEDVSLNSQMWAGYAFPLDLFQVVRRRMYNLADRYRPDGDQGVAALKRGAHYDGRATDMGLSEELMQYFLELDEENGWGYWDRGCAFYRAWLEKTEAARVAKRAIRKGLRDSAAKILLEGAERDAVVGEEHVLKDLVPRVRSALEKGLTVSGLEGLEFRQAIRRVTTEFSLKKIAAAKPDLIDLWEAAKAGMEALLEWLRNLFKAGVPEVTKPTFSVVEAEVPEAVEADAPEPAAVTEKPAPAAPQLAVAKEAPATEQDIAWLDKWDRWLGWFNDPSAAPIGSDLEALFANVRRGVATGSGLTAEQVALGFEQEAELRAWVTAEFKVQEAAAAAAPVTPPAVSTPAVQQTQAGGVSATPPLTPVPRYDPEDPTAKRWFGLASAILEARFGKGRQFVLEEAQWVAAWAAAGRFGDAAPAARKYASTPTEVRVAEVLEGIRSLADLHPALVHLSRQSPHKTAAAALKFVAGREMNK